MTCKLPSAGTRLPKPPLPLPPDVARSCSGSSSAFGGGIVVAISFRAFLSNVLSIPRLVSAGRFQSPLRRVLHDVIRARRGLHSELVCVVVHHRILSAKVVPRWRRRHDP